MNKDKAIQLLERLQDPEPYEPMLTKDAYDAIQMAIDALSADGDTISRQAAIEALAEDMPQAYTPDGSHPADEGIFMAQEIYADCIQTLRELPPAQPESDSGRWERHYSRPGVYADLYWHCSKCGYKTDYQYAPVNHRYCPNCGRKMEREVTT